MTPGDTILQFEGYGVSFVVRYDERRAHGDNGRPWPGHTTGDYEVCTGTIADLFCQVCIQQSTCDPTTKCRADSDCSAYLDCAMTCPAM